jgi:hypothetical protein
VFKRKLYYNQVRQTFGRFPIQNGPKQGEGLKMRGTQQSLLCADDSDSVGESITTTVRQHKSALLVVSKEVVMTVNAIKAM